MLPWKLFYKKTEKRLTKSSAKLPVDFELNELENVFVRRLLIHMELPPKIVRRAPYNFETSTTDWNDLRKSGWNQKFPFLWKFTIFYGGKFEIHRKYLIISNRHFASKEKCKSNFFITKTFILNIYQKWLCFNVDAINVKRKFDIKVNWRSTNRIVISVFWVSIKTNDFLGAVVIRRHGGAVSPRMVNKAKGKTTLGALVIRHTCGDG